MHVLHAMQAERRCLTATLVGLQAVSFGWSRHENKASQCVCVGWSQHENIASHFVFVWEPRSTTSIRLLRISSHPHSPSHSPHARRRPGDGGSEQKQITCGFERLIAHSKQLWSRTPQPPPPSTFSELLGVACH